MSLVEPVLRALVWDTGDPRQVWPDYTHPMKDGEDGSTRSVNLMLFMETAGTWVAIEVIPLGSEPHPEAPERRRQVCRETNTPLAVVTNGTSWWFHTNPGDGRRETGDLSGPGEATGPPGGAGTDDPLGNERGGGGKVTTGKFEQTGPTRAHMHSDTQEGRVVVWITHPGRVENSETGRPLTARQSFIIGRLENRPQEGWEADGELRGYLERIQDSPRTRWDDLDEAQADIDARVRSQWQRREEEEKR